MYILNCLNTFEGHLPAISTSNIFEGFTNLSSLIIASNSFNGTISITYTILSQLKTLDFEKNSLSGDSNCDVNQVIEKILFIKIQCEWIGENKNFDILFKCRHHPDEHWIFDEFEVLLPQ
jgi:hypothetical protein